MSAPPSCSCGPSAAARSGVAILSLTKLLFLLSCVSMVGARLTASGGCAMVDMSTVNLFSIGRRAALSGWALNLSVVCLSAGLISDAFFTLSMALKMAAYVVGLILAVAGV